MPAGQTSAHPPAPAEKQTPPAPPNPSVTPTREQNKREETLGAKLSSHALRVAKDRLAHIVKNDRVKDVMVEAESMGVDQILNKTLNEISSVSIFHLSSLCLSFLATGSNFFLCSQALLSATAARTRAQASIDQARAKAIERY